MATCKSISADILKDCDYPLAGGANDLLMLINKSDWDDATVTYDNTNPIKITNIVFAVTSPVTEGYIIEGQNNSVEPQATVVQLTYSKAYDHEVIFKIFNNNATIKEQVNNLVNGKVVAIVWNNFKNADGSNAFEIYGAETGLEVVEGGRNVSDTDTLGAWSLTLRNNEKSRPSTPPHSLDAGSFAASKAIWDSLQ